VAEGKLFSEDGNLVIEDEHQSQKPESEWGFFIREKLEKNQMLEAEAALESSIPTGDLPQAKIVGVPRFFQDLNVLLMLFASNAPCPRSEC
jgi:hypothetical protein